MCTDVCPGRARPPRNTAVHGLRAGGRVPHVGSGAPQCWHPAALGAPGRVCACWTRSVPGSVASGGPALSSVLRPVCLSLPVRIHGGSHTYPVVSRCFVRVGVQPGAPVAVQAARSGWGLCGTHWGQSYNRDLSVEGLSVGLWFVEVGT